MNYKSYNKFCKTLAASTYVKQWGGAHVWKVGGKVFAIGGWGKNDMPAYSFKTSELNFMILSEEPGYRPAPYMAARGMKWIQKDSPDESRRDSALIDCLVDSHRLVSLGLTKKLQKELGLNQAGNK